MFLLLLFLAVLAAQAPTATGPTLAVEDTMHTEVPEVLVRAPRVTLEEILDRVARGEARRESLLVDQNFRVAMRVFRNVTGPGNPRLVDESVWRVYRKRPQKVRAVLMRRVQPELKKHRAKADFDVDFSPGMGEEIVHFAFQPEMRKRFRYQLEGRDLVGNHLIYRVAFEPRSLLTGDPSGQVWIDTNEFVIVREEVFFHQSPVPLILKRLHRMIVERRRAGDTWVLGRVLVRAELSLPFPVVGSSFDMSLVYDDYIINAGLPDSLFVDARGK